MGKKVQMHYDKEQQQWLVPLNDRYYGLHCGEHLEIFIGKAAVPCRLELDLSWYVIMDNARFYLRENDTYLVNV